MVEWLENSTQDRPSNLQVWGVEKTSYTFKDLKAYLEQADRKGKKKAKVMDKPSGEKKDHKKARKQVK